MDKGNVRIAIIFYSISWIMFYLFYGSMRFVGSINYIIPSIEKSFVVFNCPGLLAVYPSLTLNAIAYWAGFMLTILATLIVAYLQFKDSTARLGTLISIIIWGLAAIFGLASILTISPVIANIYTIINDEINTAFYSVGTALVGLSLYDLAKTKFAKAGVIIVGIVSILESEGFFLTILANLYLTTIPYVLVYDVFPIIIFAGLIMTSFLIERKS